VRPLYVAVCGAGAPATDEEKAQAEQIGRGLARAGAIVVTGGLDGVMAAAAKGANEAGGTAIGILSSDRPEDGNPHNTVVVPTGLGEARNVIIVNAADAVIAVGGEFGTLSEIAFALRIRLPVVGLGTWNVTRDGVEVPMLHATSADEAVGLAIEAAGERRATR
jgi:uncharacterized protein (TIGR00725 family)